MNTESTSTHAKADAHVSKTQSKFWQEAESNRYGWIAMQLLIVGCLGGITAAFVLPISLIAVALLGLASVTALTTMLAGLPMKWVLGTGLTAGIIDILVILFVLI